jgi:hypothetical protein
MAQSCQVSEEDLLYLVTTEVCIFVPTTTQKRETVPSLFPSPSALIILILINFTHILAYFLQALKTMLFSSKTCRFALFSFLSLSANAETLRGTRRELDTPAVDLGTAKNYAILAKTGISTVPDSAITGDIAVSPIVAAAMTGFAFAKDITDTFATSEQLTGKAYASNYAVPIPATLTTAVSDMETAYTDVAGRPQPDAARINLGQGVLGGDNAGGPTAPLTPGVYTFSSNVLLSGDIHFDGSNTDIFIIQIAGNLVQDADYKVILKGGAKAENIFWQVAGFVTVNGGAHMEGIILAKTSVTFITESSLNGRILSQTACVLQKATIVEPTDSL